jgi:hypothetical protein
VKKCDRTQYNVYISVDTFRFIIHIRMKWLGFAAWSKNLKSCPKLRELDEDGKKY